MADQKRLDEAVIAKAREYQPWADALLKEAIRIPADFVDRPEEDGGDPLCGISNHEGPRLEMLREEIIRGGAVDRPADVGIDAYGNLAWTVEDPDDGIPRDDKKVVLLDGHSDTVQALRPRWLDTLGGGLDAYLGLTDPERLDRNVLKSELGYLPPDDQWGELIWGRGSADQLGGVICQIVASRILRELRPLGSLRGVRLVSYATATEEDNEGAGPLFMLQQGLPEKGISPPDVVIFTEGTGCAKAGALGIYRGQRGRMQIEVAVTGKSCHGSMPWEGRNPLEYGAAIIAEAADRYRRGEGFGSDPFLGSGTRTASWTTLESPSDCAVPERFSFRLDRRLTAGEDPVRAVADVAGMESVRVAREAGLQVEVRVPIYDQPTWRGYRPGNEQSYPGWVTPEDHPAVLAAVESYRRASSALIPEGGLFRREPRVGRWVFSTDGVGFLRRSDQDGEEGRDWVTSGPFRYPPMLGMGPGIEQNTHKVGECVDRRELAPVIAFLALFPSLFVHPR